MDIRNNSISAVFYSPEWHSRLFDYMRMVYPHRDPNYLDWWLTNIDSAGEDCWQKCIMVITGREIIGCTTANKNYIHIDQSIEAFYSKGNTIISPNQRGRGISKLLYNQVNSYSNWFSFGITDIAWKIQPRYIRNFIPIRPINVYVSLNYSILRQLFRRFFHRLLPLRHFPEKLVINSYDTLNRVTNIESMEIPRDGKWTSDDLEFIRDKKFLWKRFIDIYCAERYGIYQYMSQSRIIGYVVLRKIVYKGLDMVSLVDYRFFSQDNEYKAFKAASKFARYLGIGLVLTLTSREYKLGVHPLTIMMKKKLNCAVGLKQYRDKFNNMLITSADSDLDFVYYK